MPENIPFKRGKEDMPEPGLTAAKAVEDAIKAVEEKQKLRGRKHFGRGEAKNLDPEKKKEEIYTDYQRFEGEGDNW